MKSTLLLCSVTVIAFVTRPASAGDLIAVSDTFYTTLFPNPNGNVDVYLAYSDPLGPDPVGMLQVFNVGALEVALGTQVLMSGDMAEFINLVTNGVNDSIYLGAASQTDRDDHVMMESDFFYNGPGPGMPDLAGATIDEVRVLLSSYGPGPNGTIEIGVNYYFFGTIPGPAAAWVFALAGLGVRRRARSA